MQAKTKTILAIAAVPVLFGAWAAFRPELLFVNQKVNEAAPSASTSKVLGSGEFKSYAHETKGTAQILQTPSGKVLRLSGFSTSNGPDVHVLLLKGNNPDKVAAGSYIDLGSIKANIGDQNYTLPADADDSYQSVNIWCARFSVGFGGAALTSEKVSFNFGSLDSVGASTEAIRVQPVFFGEEIKVTGGKFRADVPGVVGRADLIESKGTRFLRLTGVKVPKGVQAEVYLVKKETVAKGADISSFTKVKLGTLGSAKQFPVAKDIDAWLYRSVTLWDAGAKRALGSAALRSDQELKSKGTL